MLVSAQPTIGHIHDPRLILTLQIQLILTLSFVLDRKQILYAAGLMPANQLTLQKCTMTVA